MYCATLYFVSVHVLVIRMECTCLASLVEKYLVLFFAGMSSQVCSSQFSLNTVLGSQIDRFQFQLVYFYTTRLLPRSVAFELGAWR